MAQSHLHDPSVVSLVNALVAHAITLGASDIHIESTHHGVRVRFRIDGMLYDQKTYDKKSGQQILSRIKILASLDIAQTRVPQDGSFSLRSDQQTIDFRVSTFPSLYGETIVMRILDREHQVIDLPMLGFSYAMRQLFEELLAKPSGFLLVTGPTGSGKTTTLYAALSALHNAEKNIITLEDPVEYSLDGITQGQINTLAGFTFEKGMRAMLRQDPDIIMIGEIRDKQTARIAIEAAMTGHLVMSTLHTNDAPAALMRLLDMGIEPFLLNASLTGVLAQRLARRICQHCKISYKPTPQEAVILERFGVKAQPLHKGQGCGQCHEGYKGRIGIFELLVISDALRALLVQHPIIEHLYAQAHADGMVSLQADGITKVVEGHTTLEELMRIIA